MHPRWLNRGVGGIGANLAASAIAGAVWTLVSPRAAFLYLAGWAAVSVVALAAVRR